MMNKQDEPQAPQAFTLLEKLHAETAQIHWSELERHFARGVVLKVSTSKDLVKMAIAMVEDDAGQIADWMNSGDLSKVSVGDAKNWSERDSSLWAVVAAPWVLVQEMV